MSAPTQIFSTRFRPQRGAMESHRVARGHQTMRDSRTVICGLARDVASVLPSTIHAVEQLGEMFADYRVVLFENDSTDGTDAMLRAWSATNSRVQVVSERLHDPVNRPIRCLARASRMASYRNRYMAEIADRYTNFDYAMVVDTDLGGCWDASGVANTFGHDDWDFVGSNGLLERHNGRDYETVQYDAWAFREFGSFDPIATKHVNRLTLDNSQQLLPVYSCFGGLGIYQMPALLSANYSGEDCEHVTLHRKMRQAGYARTFLNAEQLTYYGRRQASAWRRMRGRLFAAAGMIHGKAA